MRHKETHWPFLMTEVLVDAVADTLAEFKVEELGQILADLKNEALLQALGDSIAEVQAKTL